MARCTFSTTFYCRSSKTNKQGLAPLELSITINQQRLFLNLPAKFNPKDFNKKRKPQYIQNILNEYNIKINEVVYSLMADNLPITANSLRDYLRTGGSKSYTLDRLIKEYIEHIKTRLKPTAVRKYELVGDFMIKHLTPTKELCTLTNGDCIKLYDELKSVFLPSTAVGYCTKMKTIITYAKDNGYIKINPFNGIKLDKGKPIISYLTNEEIEGIKSLKLEDYPRLGKVRDLFLFQICTGLAYADLITFDVTKIVYTNNVIIYQNNRVKTDTEFVSVILPTGVEILDKYNNQLPLISNQKYNTYLKEIQKLVGIKTNLTTHLARKTYGHILLNKGVRLEIVSKALGHSNTLITQKVYCQTTTSTIANEVSKALSI